VVKVRNRKMKCLDNRSGPQYSGPEGGQARERGAESALMIDLGLRGRVALVTGATQGVGRAAARMFAAEGAWVAVNYRADIRGAKALVDEIRSDGGRALPVPGDVRSAEGAWTVARYIEDEWVRIDVLLHAAPVAGVEEVVDDVEPLLAEVAPGMGERGWGRIVVFAAGDAAGGPGLDVAGVGAGVLANRIVVPVGERAGWLDEAAARAALFLGSAWNVCLTGGVLDLGTELW
jgi:3-oxoacyl-[acyl-carrier protein] reductase